MTTANHLTEYERVTFSWVDQELEPLLNVHARSEDRGRPHHHKPLNRARISDFQPGRLGT